MIATRFRLLLLTVVLGGTGSFAPSTKTARAQATFAEEVAQASYVEPVDATELADAHAATAKQAEEIDVVRQLARHRGGQAAALAQIIQMSRAFDDAIAAEMIDELATAHLRAGDLNLAADSRRVLAEQYPGAPRAQEALLWLVRLYASSEMVHARRQPSAGAIDMLRQLPPNADLSQARVNSAVRRERRQRTGSPASAAQPAAPYAIHLASQAMDRHPELADNQALAYQRAVAARLAGQQKSAQAFLSPLKHRRAGDPWGDCARAEGWLETGAKERAPKPTTTCVFADDPPQLDGVLSESFWQLAIPMPLQRNDHDAPANGPDALNRAAAPPEQAPIAAAQVQLAYDREYLYIAAVCDKAPGVSYPLGVGARPRDADVDKHDHVCLRFDLDRDYASAYELLIDSRGWTADRCWGDSAWNPQWFVAASELNHQGTRWIVEAAIPWSELTPTPPKTGHAWACSIVRDIPSPHPEQPARQTWVGPTNQPLDPANFGLLLFE